MMVAELCKYTQTPAHFRRVALTVCELYLKLKKKTKPKHARKIWGGRKIPPVSQRKRKAGWNVLWEKPQHDSFKSRGWRSHLWAGTSMTPANAVFRPPSTTTLASKQLEPSSTWCKVVWLRAKLSGFEKLWSKYRVHYGMLTKMNRKGINIKCPFFPPQNRKQTS